jgi:hypothetical protein
MTNYAHAFNLQAPSARMFRNYFHSDRLPGARNYYVSVRRDAETPDVSNEHGGADEKGPALTKAQGY